MNLKNKRFLVTGGAGFLGSFVVEKLRSHGYTKIIVARHEDYNLVSMGAVRRLYADSRPEIVIHLAAKVGGIGANQAHPGEFFYDNLIMGAQLMEVGRQMHIEKFIAIGTVCAYPKHTPVPFQESDLWNGYPEETNAPYGLAKKMLLVQAQAYRQQYGFNVIYLLPVNLYGPGDNFNPDSSHVIPALIRKILKAQKMRTNYIEVWGDGTASREFLYVEDAAEAIVLATEKYNKGDPINIGAGREITIKDLITTICHLLNFSGDVRWDTSKPNGQSRRCLDTTRAEKEFGFKATTDFLTGLKKTIAWYLKHKDR